MFYCEFFLKWLEEMCVIKLLTVDIMLGGIGLNGYGTGNAV